MSLKTNRERTLHDKSAIIHSGRTDGVQFGRIVLEKLLRTTGKYKNNVRIPHNFITNQIHNNVNPT